jgi:MFS family permease
MTLAGDNLPDEKMASGMGVYGVGSAIGAALAPSIGIKLLNLGERLAGPELGFRLAFLFASCMMFLSIIPSVVLTPDRRRADARARVGAWYADILSVQTLPATGVMFLLVMAYALYNVYMVEFAAERGIEGVGAFFTVMALTLIFSRPLSGRLTDKLGAGKTMFPGMALFALSFVIVSSSRSLAQILAGAVVAALGYGAAQPAVQAMCLQSVPAEKHGVASNTVYIGMDLGLFLGPLYGGVMYEKLGFSVMYLTAVIPVALAIALFAVISRRPAQSRGL